MAEIKMGKITLQTKPESPFDDNKIWLQHESDEGMHADERLFNLMEEWFKEHM